MSVSLISWLEVLGLEQYAGALIRHGIGVEELPSLTDEDLKKIGVSLRNRERFMKAIEKPPLNSSKTRISAPPIADAESHRLTVMFCDLVGSTALSVRHDPEDLREIIDSYRTCCTDVIKRFKGHVARYSGDGVLVYFGYPEADESDPERAVRAGLAVVEEVGQLETHAELKLQTRVGIATGDVFVGDLIGEGIAKEQVVVGQTPILAAHLQTMAEPDSVVISDSCRRLAGESFQYVDSGTLQLEGIDEPVPAWRVSEWVHPANSSNAVTASETAALQAPSGVDATPASQVERRQLTLMFCALSDSTALSARYEPETLRQVIDDFRTTCDDIIKRFEGNVARYMGEDGLMVYFGYPQAHEHDAEYALRTALAIMAEVGQIEVHPGLKLQTQVGIATGEVVVGDLIGEGVAQEQSVVGQTPNLAARLQTLAEPDSVVISDITRRLAGDFFEYVDLGVHRLKGFDEPVPAWRVVTELAVESRFLATHPEVELGSLVGRDKELNLLSQRWQQAMGGAGQVVELVAEPGIGKSRLIQALRAKVIEPHTSVHYYGVPHHQASVLFPVIDQLTRAARFASEDDAQTKLEKLEELLAKATEDVAGAAPLFAALFSIPTGKRYPPLNLSAELQKERTLAALLAQMTGLAQRQPLLVIFEDLHWIDPTTLELLERVVMQSRDLPALVVLSYRPDFAPPWSADHHVTKVVLDRLGRAECGALITRVTGDKALPTEVFENIVAKTDGVPLFVEELTKTVLESGLLKEEKDRYTLTGPLPALALPNTLQDSLMARLDRLGPVKELAQIGAVIGRQFAYPLIASVSSLGDTGLQHGLARLTEAELVFRRGTPPKATYSFKHALVQDTAYSSLLRGKRRNLHQRIARELERQYPDIVNTEPELLAHHFTEAALGLQAIPYWQRAGQSAGDRAAHTEAIKHLSNALELVSELPEDTTRDRLELGVEVLFGRSLASSRGYAVPEVAHTYQRARDLCERLGNAEELFPVLSGLVTFYVVSAEHTAAQEQAEQCLRNAQSAGKPEYLIDAYRSLGFTHFFLGDLEAALGSIEQCLAHYEAHDGSRLTFLTPENPAVASLALQQLVLWLLGYPDQALQSKQKALSMAGELEQPFNIAFVHPWSAVLHRWRCEPEKSAEHAEAAIQISSEFGFGNWLGAGYMHLGIAKGLLGEAEAGLSLLNQTLPGLRAAGAEAFVSYYLGGLAEIQGVSGELDAALAHAAEALVHSNRHKEHFNESALHHLRGELSLAHAAGAQDTVEADFLRAIAIARAQSARSLELRATISLHRLRCNQDRGGESHAALARLYEGFSEGFDTSDLREAARLLAQRR